MTAKELLEGLQGQTIMSVVVIPHCSEDQNHYVERFELTLSDGRKLEVQAHCIGYGDDSGTWISVES